MSEAKVGNEGQDSQTVAGGDTQPASSGMVKYESYEKLLSQKKATDAKLKEFEAELNERRAREKAEEESKLLTEKRHVELLDRYKAENDELKKRIAATQSEIANSIKRQAIEREIGGFARPEYAQFVNLEAIQFGDDGMVDPTSLAQEAARIRENHATLLKATVKLPQSGAPKPAQRQTSEADPYWAEIKDKLGFDPRSI